MADLLVLRPEVVPHDPDDPGAWLAGMPVDVFPDGQLGPGTQQHQNFFIVRIPGVPVEDVRDLLDAIHGAANEFGELPLLKKRKWSFDFDTAPQAILDTISTEREITVTETEFRNFLKQLS